ncbi:MAG: hypothetical protein HKL90_13810 [Elusimicrobia bacterium]|nr:hypothetical protein [Elusimicrobiota bacterium]
MTDGEKISAARALQDRIEAAFRGVPYPGDENISTCPEGGGPAEDYEEIAAAFAGKKWQDWKDSPLSLVGAPDTALSFLDPTAFRYYLPLFLISATRYYEKANLIPGSVVTAFMPGKEAGTKRWGDKRLALLSLEQLKTVKACLGFLKSAHGEDFLDDEIDLAVQNVDHEIGRRYRGTGSSKT